MKALIIERLNPAWTGSPPPSTGTTERELVAVVEDGTSERLRGWLASTAQRRNTIGPYTTASFEAAAVDANTHRLLNGWLDEAIGDIKDGLDRPDRFPANTRRFRIGRR